MLVTQENETQRTIGLLNGAYWNGLGAGQRLEYATAHMDAMQWVAASFHLDRTKNVVDWPSWTCGIIPYNLTPAGLSEALSFLYEDPLNVLLPITVVISIIILWVKGVPRFRIDEMLANGRAYCSKPDNAAGDPETLFVYLN